MHRPDGNKILSTISPETCLLRIMLLWSLLVPTMSAAADISPDSVMELQPVQIDIDFVINRSDINPAFSDNAGSISAMDSLFNETSSDSTISIRNVSFRGAASPDGGLNLNRVLSERRMNSLKNFVSGRYALPDSVISAQGSEIPWNTFRSLVATTPFAGSERVLEIINQGDDNNAADVNRRLALLRTHNSGRTWRLLAGEFFPRLRLASMTVERMQTIPQRSPEPVFESCEAEAEEAVKEIVEEKAVEEVAEATPGPVPAARCHRSWHASTNVLAWTLGMTNLMGEYDFGCHWSVALSLYYSAWNYAKATRKFRAFIFRPELRWWLGEGHRGLFVDGHIQMAAYNFALPGWEYRIQDVGGRHPALGGGIGVGYRLPLGRSGRCAAEAAIGVGVYHLEYNRFVNEENGALVDRRERTFFGLDNVSVSVVYNFNAFGR